MTATKELALGRPGATKRMEEIRKEHGAKQAKEIQAKAQEIAIAAGSRNIKLEHIAEAQGVTLSADEIASYRGKTAKPAAKKPAAKKQKTADKNGGKQPAADKPAASGKSGSSGNAAAAPAQKRRRSAAKQPTQSTEDGSESSRPSSSKVDQLRELREKQAKEKTTLV